MQAVLNSYMAKKATATIAQVVAVYGGGVGPVGTVDVQFLVNQVDRSGVATPHGVAKGLPYLRYQGGSNAVICDPAVGDIGTVVFASRDISSVKKNKKQSNPGSFRKFSMSDGMYLPGILNGTPQTYLQLGTGQANLVAPVQIKLDAPEVVVTGNLTVANGVTTMIQDISGKLVMLIGGVGYSSNNSGG